MVKLECFTQKSGYKICQTGSHFSGSYIRVYIPDEATQPGAKLQTITYLHGFALCMPSFYEEHLEALVQAGYIVLFPDFQRSFYPAPLPTQATPTAQMNQNYLQYWANVAGVETVGDRLSIAETPTLGESAKKEKLGPGWAEPSQRDARAVGRSLFLISLILTILRWFNQKFGKHLIHLLSTVGISLFHRATESLDNAIALSQETWEDLCQHYPHWRTADIDSFTFGHSLGGLIALSLPSGYQGRKNQVLRPQKIIVADPAASTEMGIPKFAIALLKCFNSPFTQSPILVTQTGPDIDVPVVVLHGGADKLVQPSTWRVGQENSKNFDAIAVLEKQVYFSYSNPEHQLVAFHNQAVTSTQYYDDAVFENFGGVKNGANAYNYQYVWPGLELIVTGKATPQDLISQLPPRSFEVSPEPPSQNH